MKPIKKSDDYSQMVRDLLSTNIHGLNEIIISSVFNDEIHFYAKVLVAYMQKNITLIKNLNSTIEIELHSIKDTPTYLSLKALAKARVDLRLEKIDPSIVNDLITATNYETEYRGEVYFVLGLIYKEQNELLLSNNAYLKAAHYFEKQGIKTKHLKALNNIIINECVLSPHENFIPQYEYLVKKALELGEYSVAGTNFNNISYEYEKAGAYRAALSYCQQSLNLLEKYAYHSLNFYLALSQRCSIYIKLERLHEASLDYEMLKLSSFKEMKEISHALNIKLNTNISTKVEIKNLPPSWKYKLTKNRFLKKPFRLNLTESEEKIITYLLKNNHSLPDLADLIYGSLINPTSSQNRIKVLISNIRKKKPGLIIYTDGKYTLSEVLMPEMNIKKVI